MENMEGATNLYQNGAVDISEEVVAIVASVATGEVQGVSGMSGNITGGIAEFLGKKNLSKGVKITMEPDNVSIDLSIIVEYGCKIPEVATAVQERVKSSVETMTGLTVSRVNVKIDAVNMEAEPSA